MRTKKEVKKKSRDNPERTEAFIDEYRSMFWEANKYQQNNIQSDNEKSLLDNETMTAYNDFKYLVYLEKFFDKTREL